MRVSQYLINTISSFVQQVGRIVEMYNEQRTGPG